MLRTNVSEVHEVEMQAAPDLISHAPGAGMDLITWTSPVVDRRLTSSDLWSCSTPAAPCPPPSINLQGGHHQRPQPEPAVPVQGGVRGCRATGAPACESVCIFFPLTRGAEELPGPATHAPRPALQVMPHARVRCTAVHWLVRLCA